MLEIEASLGCDVEPRNVSVSGFVRRVQQIECKVMQVMNERSDQNALTIDRSASVLGLHEFSLLSRIQAGEIKSARARSGEMLIPGNEVERLAGAPISAQASGQCRPAKRSDERLGIEWTYGGLHRDGKTLSYKVPGHVGRFTATEIKSYQAAFGEIAEAVESLTGLKKQLSEPGQILVTSEIEICASQIGRWQVRSTLLNLGQSEILLCEREDDFSVIERFRGKSLYAKANGDAEILLRGDDARQLTEDFKANAQLTLEFMASNLVAKAQKVVWEQFPDDRPGRIVAAISERCRQAVANEETISQDRKQTRSVNRGIRI
jgi:hypothetical protein